MPLLSNTAMRHWICANGHVATIYSMYVGRHGVYTFHPIFFQEGSMHRASASHFALDGPHSACMQLLPAHVPDALPLQAQEMV